MVAVSQHLITRGSPREGTPHQQHVPTLSQGTAGPCQAHTPSTRGCTMARREWTAFHAGTMLRWTAMLLFAVWLLPTATSAGDGVLHHDASTYGMAYHSFVERFGGRVRASPADWGKSGTLEPEREVFLALDEDLDGIVSDEEIQRFSELVPPPAMSRTLFDAKYGSDERADPEVVDAAFTLLDKDKNDELNKEEAAHITTTLQNLANEKAGKFEL